MCSSLSVLGRIIIGILSLVFAILGLGLLIIGVLVKTNATVITNLLTSLLKSVESQAATSSGGQVSFSVSDIDINELVGGLSIVFIVIGVTMAALGIFGIGGACCQVKCMIQLYMLVVIILLVGQIILLVIIAGDRSIVTDPPKPALKSAFHQDYAGIESKNSISLLWNVIMTGIQCCGIDDVSDIMNATRWKESNEKTFKGPVACCKPGEFKDANSDCVRNPTSANSNVDTPCYEKLWDLAFHGIPFIIGACADLGFLTLLAIFSGVIVNEINKKNKVSPY